MQNRYVFFFVLLAVGMHPWGIIADNAQEKNATSLRKKIMYGAIVTLAIGGAMYYFRPGTVPGSQSGGNGNIIINPELPLGSSSPTNSRLSCNPLSEYGRIPVVIQSSASAQQLTRPTLLGEGDVQAQSSGQPRLHHSDIL